MYQNYFCICIMYHAYNSTWTFIYSYHALSYETRGCRLQPPSWMITCGVFIFRRSVVCNWSCVRFCFTTCSWMAVDDILPLIFNVNVATSNSWVESRSTNPISFAILCNDLPRKGSGRATKGSWRFRRPLLEGNSSYRQAISHSTSQHTTQTTCAHDRHSGRIAHTHHAA